MAKKLTEQQQIFLDVLFDEAEGDMKRAKVMAGYSDATPVKLITDALAEEILDLTRKFISNTTTKAAYAMASVIENPAGIGVKDKMAASKDILDRGGFIKTEKVEVTTTNPVFILPAKEKDGSKS